METTKTHYKILRNPNYIGGWDLLNGDKTVTITKVNKELVHDGKGGQSECCTVHFAECKPMVANSTNLKRIAKLLGSPFVEDWSNKRIILTTEKVKAFGEVHDAVRVSTKPVAKPTLTEPSKAFDNCVAALNSGKTMDDVKARYQVSDEVEAKLKEVANG
jgi:hypothetical protein